MEHFLKGAKWAEISTVDIPENDYQKRNSYNEEKRSIKSRLWEREGKQARDLHGGELEVEEQTT